MTKPRADLYSYTPTFTGAVVTASLFCVLFFIHLALLLRTKTWFCAPLAIGALCEVLGFGTRAYSHSNKRYSATNAGPLVALILQAVLILLAPLFFAATIYMFLGRIIRATGHTSLSPINIKYVTKIFVWCDVILLNVQSVGASLFTNSKGKAWMSNVGRAIVLVGLVAQICAFGFFVYVAGIWHSRMNRREGGSATVARFQWKRYMYMLYGVSGIITARNLYRVAEFAMGEDGYLNTHEWPVYALDAALMALVLVVCAFWYVSIIYDRIQEYESMELVASGVSVTEQEAKKDGGVVGKILNGINAALFGVSGIVAKMFRRN